MRPMSETQQDQSSTGSSIPSSEKIEDAFKRIKLNEDGDAQSCQYPDRPGERDCLFYMKTGLCGYGSNCRYNHPPYVSQGIVYYKDELPERVGQPDCEYFLKTGTCKYGPTCKYHHPKDRNGAGPVLFNAVGFPMRQGEKPCPYYMRTGTCRFGVACKFHHPQPVNEPSGSYGVSSFSSLGFPYVGGLTMVSLPPATYGAIPRQQLPPTYLPIMLSPPQGWPTYSAASNLIYKVKDQPDSSSNPSLPLVITSNQSLPERRDQPECRFFMNTGTCKYGIDCRYNHPKERISPVILPSRPGQATCANFKAYGFCKFGPNCKFDHSLPSYPYNTAMAMTTTMTMSPLSASPTHMRISPSDEKKPEVNPEQVNSEVKV